MKWWCFDEPHLDAALAAWVELACAGEPPAERESKEAEARGIREFLLSPAARACKLRGDNEA